MNTFLISSIMIHPSFSERISIANLASDEATLLQVGFFVTETEQTFLVCFGQAIPKTRKNVAVPSENMPDSGDVRLTYSDPQLTDSEIRLSTIGVSASL